MNVKQLKVKASIDNYQQCADFIEEQLEEKGFDMKSIFKVLTACEEIIVNVMNYAYPAGDGDLEISFADGKEYITITFTDNGTPFNPFESPPVDVSLSLEERDIGGLGILLVKELMDDVKYEYRDNKNILTIQKNFV